MEIKATLQKPYTETERVNFILVQNRQLGYRIEETEDELQAWGYTEEEKTAQREADFKSNFFEIKPANDEFQSGWYRKKPKGYTSAVESVNSLKIWYGATGVPAGVVILYEAPDFTKPEECTEEWLEAHQIKNDDWTPEQLDTFGRAFMLAWNQQEHE